MGTPEFAVPSLEALLIAGHQVCGVFTQPDKPKNRGMKIQISPVKECALSHNVPVFQPGKMRDGEALGYLRAVDPELIVVAAYGRILPDNILAYPQYGCINVHSSLLPKISWRGPYQLGHLEWRSGDWRYDYAYGLRVGCRGYHLSVRHADWRE